jgi:hypothetical protein
MGRRRCNHGDADYLESVELSDGHALQCGSCGEVVSKDWWLKATDAEIIARNDVSDAARRALGMEKKRIDAEDKARKSAGWKEAQQANGSFLLGALGWLVFFGIVWRVLNG